MNKDQLKADYDAMIEADKHHLAKEIERGETFNAGQRAATLAGLVQDRRNLGR